MADDPDFGQGSIDIKRSGRFDTFEGFGPFDQPKVETLFAGNGVSSGAQDHEVGIEQSKNFDSAIEQPIEKTDLREHQYDRKPDPRGAQQQSR